MEENIIKLGSISDGTVLFVGYWVDQNPWQEH